MNLELIPPPLPCLNCGGNFPLVRFQPCEHEKYCAGCASRIDENMECPMCNAEIGNIILTEPSLECPLRDLIQYRSTIDVQAVTETNQLLLIGSDVNGKKKIMEQFSKKFPLYGIVLTAPGPFQSDFRASVKPLGKESRLYNLELNTINAIDSSSVLSESPDVVLICVKKNNVNLKAEFLAWNSQTPAYPIFKAWVLLPGDKGKNSNPAAIDAIAARVEEVKNCAELKVRGMEFIDMTKSKRGFETVALMKKVMKMADKSRGARPAQFATTFRTSAKASFFANEEV